MSNLRPADTINPNEWLRLARAKKATGDKLFALLPSWIKTHLSPPKKHPDGLFTFAELRHVPGAQPKLPNLTTTVRKVVARRFPQPHITDTATYISEFLSLNSLRRD